MPAKNEILPLDAGPSRNTLTPMPVPSKLSKRNEAVNTDAATAQERRIRLVSMQRRYTGFQLFYGLFGIALMVVQMEYLWLSNTKDFDGTCHVDSLTLCPSCLDSLAHTVPVEEGHMMLHALRVLISFSTIILLYYIYAFYAAECEVLKIKNIVPPTATLLSSPLRFRLLIEMLVFVVHPFPGLDTIDQRWPNLVVATSLLMFLRVFLLFRIVQFRNSFNSSNGWFIGALTNVDFTATFFLKSTLKNHPSRCILASFLLLLIITGYSLYVVERYLCAFVADSCCTPLRFADSLWVLVITMLTIGYGDIVPHTTAGRLFAVLAGLFGTLFTAVTIAVMSSYLVLTRSEHKVNAFLKKDENRRLINDHAARAIQAYVQLRAVQRRFQGVKTKRATVMIQKAECKLYDVLHVYRQVKRFVNSHDVSDPMDKQMTMLEMMEVNVEYIRTKIEDLSELFHTQVDKHHKGKQKLQAAVISTSAAISLANAAAAAVTTAATGSGTGTGTSGALAASSGTGTPPTGGAAADSTVASDSSAISAVQAGTIGVPGSTSISLTSSFSSAVVSTATVPWASAVPGQPPIYENESSEHRRSMSATQEPAAAVRRMPTPSSSAATLSTNGSTSSSSGLNVGPLTQGSSRHLVPTVQEMPEWAIAMESMMQSILTQVTRVSTEMDSMQYRVQSQMDQLQSRIGDIEKRLGIQDAFKEVTRGASLRKLLRTPSMSHFNEANGDGGGSGESNASGSSLLNGGEGSGSMSGRGSFNLAGATRYNRKSFASQKPSIHNFVTPKDLEEFQNDGDGGGD